jgi:hypothetical protein
MRIRSKSSWEYACGKGDYTTNQTGTSTESTTVLTSKSLVSQILLWWQAKGSSSFPPITNIAHCRSAKGPTQTSVACLIGAQNLIHIEELYFTVMTTVRWLKRILFTYRRFEILRYSQYGDQLLTSFFRQNNNIYNMLAIRDNVGFASFQVVRIHHPYHSLVNTTAEMDLAEHRVYHTIRGNISPPLFT